MSTAEVVFWGALGLCAYAYLGYPALLFVVSRLRPRPVRRGEVWPRVSLIIPAHNEQDAIEVKVRNALALRYPAGRLEVLVASDGSTDRTNEIVRRYAGGPLRLLELPRRGKAHALNAAAHAAQGEVLVFSDADVLLDADSMRWLTRSFADPEVGGVCGRRCQRARNATATGGGEGLYHRLDRWLTALESRIGSIASAHGALYGIRRGLYVPIRDPAQADDIAISARVPLQGYRMVYEPRALSFEEAPRDGHREFQRKVRVTNHTTRAILLLGRGLLAHPAYAFALVSHKLVRYLVPFGLIAVFLSAIVLAPRHLGYALAFAGQLACYAAAAAAPTRRRPGAATRWLFTVPYYFALVNAAALLGLLSVARGARESAWTPGGGLAPTTGRHPPRSRRVSRRDESTPTPAPAGGWRPPR